MNIQNISNLQPNFGTIPEDTRLNICSFLEAQDIHALSQVSSATKKLCHEPEVTREIKKGRSFA